jgi:DNA primase
VQALASAAPMVSAIKDWSLRGEYARRLAGWLGMDESEVLTRVRGGQPDAPSPQREAPRRRTESPQQRPDPRDPRLIVEREAAKLVVQRPALAGPVFDGLGVECFTSPAYAAIAAAVAKAGGAARAAGGPAWVAAVQEGAETDAVRELATELAVEPMQSVDDGDPRYAKALLLRLQEMALTRRIQELKSRLQRLNPIESAEDYNRLFGELIVLERQKKGLRDDLVDGL